MRPGSRKRVVRPGLSRGEASRLVEGSDGGRLGRPRDEEASDPAVWHWRERERPGASVIWQTVAVVFLGFAFAATLAALTLTGSMHVRASELWISAVGFAFLAVACFLAHWDVNRGRRSRDVEIEEARG